MRPNNFDLIRLLAATQVVVFHCVHHLKPPGAEQFILHQWLDYFPGVPIFFLISGFLVSASYERSKSQKDYWINRSLRIFPALWVCFAVSVISVLVLAPNLILEANPKSLTAWVLAQVSFFQYYNPGFLRPYGVGALNGSLWTIPVELQFYLGLPLLYGILKIAKPKSNLRLIGAFLCFAILAQIIYRLPIEYHSQIWFKLIECSMLPHFWLFLIGVILQRNFEQVKWLFENKIWYWLGLHFTLILIAQQLGIASGYNKDVSDSGDFGFWRRDRRCVLLSNSVRQNSVRQ